MDVISFGPLSIICGRLISTFILAFYTSSVSSLVPSHTARGRIKMHWCWKIAQDCHLCQENHKIKVDRIKFKIWAISFLFENFARKLLNLFEIVMKMKLVGWVKKNLLDSSLVEKHVCLVRALAVGMHITMYNTALKSGTLCFMGEIKGLKPKKYLL